MLPFVAGTAPGPLGSGVGTGTDGPEFGPGPPPFETAVLPRLAASEVDPAEINALGITLRQSPDLWRLLAQFVPRCKGSMAAEFIVVVCPTGLATTLVRCSPAHRDEVDRTIRLLMGRAGLSAPHCARFSAAVIDHIETTNRLIANVVALHLQQCDPSVLVLRVAMKAVGSVRVNPTTHSVWFQNGHANAMLVDAVCKTAVLLEPDPGPPPVPELIRLLRRSVFHEFPEFNIVYGTRPPDLELSSFSGGGEGETGDSSAPSLWSSNLCTLWCAAASLIGLANSITNPFCTHRVLAWIHGHRDDMIHAFLFHAFEILKTFPPAPS